MYVGFCLAECQAECRGPWASCSTPVTATEMCDGKTKPQTVTVKYTENALMQLACIQEAEPLLFQALGKGITDNDAKPTMGSIVVRASHRGVGVGVISPMSTPKT